MMICSTYDASAHPPQRGGQHPAAGAAEGMRGESEAGGHPAHVAGAEVAEKTFIDYLWSQYDYTQLGAIEVSLPLPCSSEYGSSWASEVV